MKIWNQKSVLFTLFIVMALVSLGDAFGAQLATAKVQQVVVAEPKNQKQYLEGHIVGVSRKAKIVTLQIGERFELISFDDKSKGLEFARRGENVLVRIVDSLQRKMAAEFVPKLAHLPEGVEEIFEDELIELVHGQQENYMLIDVRSANRFQEAHIPSAHSLPLIEMQQNPRHLEQIGSQAKKLIFYSNGTTCGLCTRAAEIAVKSGYKDVGVLLSGFHGWEEEGELLAVGDALINSGAVVLIDIRNPTEVQAGHIPSAVGIPLVDLSGEMEYEMPTRRKAPLVFYGKAEDLRRAATVVRKWGFRNVFQVDGGMLGWQSRGGASVVGAAKQAEALSWLPRLNPMQIAKKDFKKTVAQHRQDITILDVRTEREAKRGGFKNAVHIPFESLADRIGEIPKGKKVVTHCASGERAEMAALFLSQFRADVQYLEAKVRCKGDKCRVK